MKADETSSVTVEIKKRECRRMIKLGKTEVQTLLNIERI